MYGRFLDVEIKLAGRLSGKRDGRYHTVLQSLSSTQDTVLHSLRGRRKRGDDGVVPIGAATIVDARSR